MDPGEDPNTRKTRGGFFRKPPPPKKQPVVKSDRSEMSEMSSEEFQRTTQALLDLGNGEESKGGVIAKRDSDQTELLTVHRAESPKAPTPPPPPKGPFQFTKKVPPSTPHQGYSSNGC